MAYKNFEAGSGFNATVSTGEKFIFKATGENITLPETSYIRDAEMLRDGMDLLLKTDAGQITIENYFAVETSPNLIGPNNTMLAPQLVNSFVKSAPTYASNSTMTDESPVGLVSETNGDATVTRTDGSVETIHIGIEIYQGDIIETSGNGAVNITFTDESSFAVSESARLAIDEYVYDPSTESGVTDFSVLKGMFVYTSGLIGRDDPDDVNIDTPVGSIGIRGTIIAGDVNTGEITVVEGAIVLRDFDGYEVTLANQFETAKFDTDGKGIQPMGELSASDVAGKFATVSNVAPKLFSSINDAAAEQKGSEEATDTEGNAEETQDDSTAEPQEAGEEDEQSSSDESTSGESTKQPSDTSKTQQDGESAELSTKSQLGESEARNPELNSNGKFGNGLNNLNGFSGHQNTAGENSQPVSETARAFFKDLNLSQNIISSTLNARTTQSTTETSSTPHHTAVEQTAINVGFIGKGLSEGLDERSAQDQTPNQLLLFRFNQLFGEANKYELDAESVGLLNSLRAGGDEDPSLLDNTGLDQSGNTVALNGWNFDTNKGVLKLYINEQADWNIDDILSFNIKVKAKIGDNWTDYKGATFTAYDADGVTPDGENIATKNIGNGVFYHNSESANISSQSDYNGPSTIFIKDGIGDDGVYEQINLSNVDNHKIYVGEGGKRVNVDINSTGNTIYGGNNPGSDDTFNVSNPMNKVLAMDGNDKIHLFLNAFFEVSQNLDFSKIKLDGGQGQDKLIVHSDNMAELGIFMGAASQAIDNIEHLEIHTGHTQGAITLTLQDVINMTDHNNELHLSAEGDIPLQANLNGFQDTGEDTGDDLFSIWQGQKGDQTVTLYVENADINAVQV
jgi:hypothetical protein